MQMQFINIPQTIEIPADYLIVVLATNNFVCIHENKNRLLCCLNEIHKLLKVHLFLMVVVSILLSPLGLLLA